MPLRDAREYIERGWSIFPLYPRTKTPHRELLPLYTNAENKTYPSWKPYQYETASVKDVEHWFKICPAAGLGLAMGFLSGVFALDTDSPEADEWAIDALPETVEVQGSEIYKRHYYFKMPDFKITNSSKGLPKNVDVRGEGGFVVLPPSIHPTGTAYQWIRPPDACEIAVAPDWLLDLLRPKEHVAIPVAPITNPTTRHEQIASGRFRKARENCQNAGDGEKNAVVFKQAAWLAELLPHALTTEDAIVSCIFNEMVGRAKDANRLRKTIIDGIRKGRQQPAVLPI